MKGIHPGEWATRTARHVVTGRGLPAYDAPLTPAARCTSTPGAAPRPRLLAAADRARLVAQFPAPLAGWCWSARTPSARPAFEDERPKARTGLGRIPGRPEPPREKVAPGCQPRAAPSAYTPRDPSTPHGSAALTDEEFEEFYAHSVKPLVGQVYLMTGDLHEAQDVVQEAFVRAWGRRSSPRRGGRAPGLGADRGLAPRGEPVAARPQGRGGVAAPQPGAQRRGPRTRPRNRRPHRRPARPLRPPAPRRRTALRVRPERGPGRTRDRHLAPAPSRPTCRALGPPSRPVSWRRNTVSDFHGFHRDEESLARALKRAADAGGRGIVPEPAERVAARGLRRRRRNMAALAACAVCLLAGSGAAPACGSSRGRRRCPRPPHRGLAGPPPLRSVQRPRRMPEISDSAAGSASYLEGRPEPTPGPASPSRGTAEPDPRLAAPPTAPPPTPLSPLCRRLRATRHPHHPPHPLSQGAAPCPERCSPLPEISAADPHKGARTGGPGCPRISPPAGSRSLSLAAALFLAYTALGRPALPADGRPSPGTSGSSSRSSAPTPTSRRRSPI